MCKRATILEEALYALGETGVDPVGMEVLAQGPAGQSLAIGGVHAPQLAGCQHQDVFLLLVETQLLPSQAGFVQLSLRRSQLSGKGPWAVLFPVHPVHGHLVPYVVVQCTVGVVSQDLLVVRDTYILEKTSHYTGHTALSSVWLPRQLREVKEKVVATLKDLKHNVSRRLDSPAASTAAPAWLSGCRSSARAGRRSSAPATARGSQAANKCGDEGSALQTGF